MLKKRGPSHYQAGCVYQQLSTSVFVKSFFPKGKGKVIGSTLVRILFYCILFYIAYKALLAKYLPPVEAHTSLLSYIPWSVGS